MKVILTKLRMLSSFNIHVFTFEKVGNARREKAKTESIVETTQTLVWFQEKGKHTGSEKSEARAYYANFVSVEDYGYDDDTVELADAYQAHNHRLTLEVTSEKKLWTAMTTRKTTRFLRMLLWMMPLFSWQLKWTQLLDAWDNDLDPEVRARMVQADVQAYLSLGKKGKGKGKGKGKILVRPSCLSLEDRRQQMRKRTAKNECRACGRKGH